MGVKMYCNISEECKLLNQSINQYNEVVEQNRSLQRDLRLGEIETQKYRKIAVTLIENIYETFEGMLGDELERQIEEFLMIEKGKLCK